MLLTAAMAIALTGCGDGGEAKRRLDMVDTLLRTDRPQEARELIDSINPDELDNDGYEKLRLLDIQTSYKLYQPVPSDSSISANVAYWKNRGNLELECLSLCYRGMTRYSDGRHDDATADFKTAESLLGKIDDDYLKNRVYGSLTMVNYAAENYPKALEYARKEYETAGRMANNNQKAHAYNHLSCIYFKMGVGDSVMQYIKAVIPLLDDIPADLRAPHLSNVGLYYLNLGDTIKALEFGWRSRGVRPIASSANLLARVYFNRGEIDKADSIWDEAASQSSLAELISLTRTRANEYYGRGMYREAGEYNMQLDRLKDSLYRQNDAIRLQQLQLDYDHRERMDRSKNVSLSLVILTIVLILSAILVIYVLRKRYTRRIYDAARTIDEFQKQIDSLEALKHSYDREITSLRRKMEDEVRRQNDTIARGKQLYESLTDEGANTASWHKNDFGDFLSYYRVINPRLFEDMEQNYRGLSTGNRFLLTLLDMGLDNPTIERILGISSVSLRSARSRLKSKRINDIG